MTADPDASRGSGASPASAAGTPAGTSAGTDLPGSPGEDAERDAERDAGLSPAERELLAAFERLRPQGTLRWGFEDAMRRVADGAAGSATAADPWPGLPADLWERGRSAQLGQRFAGDVVGVVADLMAADARAITDAAVAMSAVAAWDALRYLAARVDRLEAGSEPMGVELVEREVPPTDPGEWTEQISGWVGDPRPGHRVVVAESGAGVLLDSLAGDGHRVLGVEPRGPLALQELNRAEGERPSVEEVFGEVLDSLAALEDGSAAGTVVTGCVDRVALADKVRILEEALRVTRPGGPVVVLTVEQVVWDSALSAVARDLAPGRPLHPETWKVLLREAGAVDVAWHRPRRGTVHALVARVAGA